MSTKSYDAEFGADPLNELKKRDILARANPVHYVPLIENLHRMVEAMEQKFQEERKPNPLLETTAPEAWIAAEIMPFVKEVRANADIDDQLLSKALQKYMQRGTKAHPISGPDGEEELHTTIEPYLSALRELVTAVCDRRKSLRRILRLSPGAYTIREALIPRKPASRRETIFLQGVRDNWPNHRIAKELDDKGLKPSNKDYKSYKEMLRTSPQLFYSLKSAIKKKYL